MEKVNIVHDLEVAYGTVYGFEEAAALMEVLQNKAPSCGKKVKEFEDAFSSYCGTKYGIAVTSATTGLTLAGIALGIKPGDEVITTPISWISTASAFSVLGAKIVFCDVEPQTLNMDPDKLERLITTKTKAIVPVHLYGRCCNMDKLIELSQKYSIPIIEDCAHNPGGEYKGRKSGSMGDIGVFSFHQQKNMSTLGEGGLVTTNRKEFFEKIINYRSLCCRIYGPNSKYLSIDEEKYPMEKEYWKLTFDDFGYNFRMTDAQAAVGIVQLKKLDNNNKRRKELADYLISKLKNVKDIILPEDEKDGINTWHLFMIQLAPNINISKRDFMWEIYTKKGIKAWSHYIPIHMSTPYVNDGHKIGECPVAEEAFNRYITFPLHPTLTFEALDYLANSIIEILKSQD